MPLPRPPGARRSVALIVTLAILAILSTMLIGFVLSSRQDRGATQSYSDSLRADQIALGAADAVVSSLRAELANPALATAYASNGFTVYLPLSPTNAPAQSTVTNLVYPLLHVSGGAGFVSNGVPITPLPASPSLSTNSSSNSRRVTLARWNKPQLVPAANAGLFPVPAWVVVGRQGPFTPSNANPLTAGAVTGLKSANEVLGRFAYAVYDLGGLLDVNAAGYPGTVGTKGLMPWADLSQVGTAADFTGFPAVRNRNTAASFPSYVASWATNGFLTVAKGDTAFLSRQELIDYATSKGFSNLLPSLTVFSRELNGPTWGPSGTYAADPRVFQGAAGPVNFFLPSVRVTAGGWARNNGIPAVANEPLVKYRFPLDKLALLQAAADPSLTPDTVSIKKYFGLVQDASTGAYKKWIYTNPTGSATLPPNNILTLDAIGNREPDFFELLKATILSGSVGLTGRGDEGAASDPDNSTDGQIIQIGLNIIDQAGTDNLPSTIAFNTWEYYGVKDLPYISQILMTCTSDHPLTAAANAAIFFNLWNPHQATAGATYPKLRLIPLGDGASVGTCTLNYVIASSGDTWSTATPISTPFSAGGGANAIAFTVTSTSYRAPALLTGGTVSGTATTIPSNNANGFTLVAPSLPSGNSSPSGIPWVTANTAGQWQLSLKANNLSFGLQYEYPASSGIYHTYAVFAGQVSGATATAIPVNAGLKFGNTSTLALANTPTLSAASPYGASYYFTKSDPRTTRWAASWNETAYDPSATGHATGGTNFKAWRFLPFGTAETAPPTASYHLSQLFLNNGTPSYSDHDTVKRPADYATGGSPYSSTTPPATEARPVVLERSFASVGELGYVFRDMPWKTLDFSSASSADAGLLDAFTVTGGLARQTVSGRLWQAAGRISPNSPLAAPLAALLSGAVANPSTLAGSLISMTTNTPYCLTNRADIATRLMNDPAAAGQITATTKAAREAVVRNLAESANTRTWNLLIDVIAQAGKYPPTAASFDDFVVTGERRYWLHVAIDRYTGEIVDEQLEAVSE